MQAAEREENDLNPYSSNAQGTHFKAKDNSWCPRTGIQNDSAPKVTHCAAEEPRNFIAFPRQKSIVEYKKLQSWRTGQEKHFRKIHNTLFKNPFHTRTMIGGKFRLTWMPDTVK